MKIKLGLVIIGLVVFISACTPSNSTETDINKVGQSIIGTVGALDTATAIADQALIELTTQQAQTAEVIALTVAAYPTETLIPTNTLTATSTNVPTATSTLTPTTVPSPTSCFVIIDTWCLSHQGCSTMDVFNKSGSTATIRITDMKEINSTFSVPPGKCGFQLRPGRYWYEFNYCGQYNEGWHALNSNWYIKFKCQ